VTTKSRTCFQDPKNTLYLIDISSFIFRAFFGVRALHSKKGEPTNAVYGVATMLSRVSEVASPENLVVVYDSKEPSFRKEIYPDYKANRTEPPDDLIPQFGRIEEMIKCFEIHSYRKSGVEADDLIATLTKQWCEMNKTHKVVVITGDKDLMQLVDGRVCIWDTMTDKVYQSDEVVEKFGVKPDQIRDYLGMVGDSSDNIPGVPSIGPKTASDLLKEYGTLDKILEAAKAGKIAGKKGDTFRQNEKDARLSAQLATVRTDLNLDLDPSFVKYHFHITEDCKTLFKELDFHTLLNRWAPETETKKQIEVSTETKNIFRVLNTEKQLIECLENLEKVKEFGFDLETTSLNPRIAKLCGLAICHDKDFGFYIPVGHQDTKTPQLPEKFVLDKLKPFLEDPKYKKIGQNLKFDFSILHYQGVEAHGIGADTMVADYVLEPEGRHNLNTLAMKYLNYSMLSYEDVCGKGKDAITFDQVPIDVATRYSAEDAWIAYRIWEIQKKKLVEQNLMDVFLKIDLPLIEVLSRMECYGVHVDVPWLKGLSKKFEGEIQKIEERIGAYTQGPVNLNSPKQLATLLFEELKLPPQSKTKTGFSTDASVLEALSPLHEVPRLLLEYREIAKLKGTYVDPLPELCDPKTNKIHAGFHQTVAATGRLSSSDPNLQNIPIRSDRGKEIRRAFIPSDGNVLMSADYSQIELRILAHMSGDKELTRSFLKDEDVHRQTASELFSIPPEKVDDKQRDIAKAINFGLMYGKTVFGLAQELKVSRTEAKAIMDRYFERYSGVKKFLDGLITGAKEKGWTSTAAGRKRVLADLKSANPMVRANAERMAMNTPIQGTASDLMKLAMQKIDAELIKRGLKSKLTIQVHDEVVLDCPKNEVEEVKRLVVDAMEGAMKLSVPLKVNVEVGANWGEL
jgi:DNA polymerase-1